MTSRRSQDAALIAIDPVDLAGEATVGPGNIGAEIAKIKDTLVMLGGFSSRVHEMAENLSGNADAAFRDARDMQDMVGQMADTVESTRKDNLLLLEESERIQAVVELLREITESTHVIGINASIVAARAGPTGKAFVVLSQEIRKLAERSSRSLATISEIVSDLRTTIGNVASRIEKSGALILGQKEGLLSVAGHLQGTVLGVDVINTVSGSSASMTQALLEEFRGVETRAESLAMGGASLGRLA